jgi:peptidoglycan/xylan/chitin deacetylase (PgdA/CDA1 family)
MYKINEVLSARFYWLLVIFALIMTIVGCSRDHKSVQPQVQRIAQTTKPVEIDLQKVKPNELGQVLILEYHEISDKEARWSRNYNNFRSDLQRLYQMGYRPVSLRDFVQNKISIPAGTSPVVITFDDGTAGQFRYINDEGKLKVDPNCAVGILENFHSKHPDWGLEATFYIYYPEPFRQSEYIGQKLQHIADDGMDIGNHTYSHVNLRKLSSTDAMKEMAMSVKSAKKYVPNAVVDSIALPYGLGPADEAILRSGEYKGQRYNNIAALLVGAEPACSPVDTRFNPYRLPRVQAIQPELDKWLGYFDKHPDKRYISDGDPNIVTIPKALEGKIDQTRLSEKKLRTY